MNYWTNKNVVITGGSSGLGWTLGQQLIAQEANVLLVARDEAKLQDACARLATGPGQVGWVSADIGDDAAVDRLAMAARARFERIDALFNVAGSSDRGIASATPLARYRELWEMNFLASVRCTQRFLPELLRSRGHVVLVGSLAAKVAPRYLGAYPTSKFPLSAFSQQLRLEHAAEGLHVLFVCPGPIARADAGQRYSDRAENLPPAAQQPGGGAKVRLLDPVDVAARILRACESRQVELVLPAKARWLFALTQLWPAWGDRLLLGRSG